MKKLLSQFIFLMVSFIIACGGDDSDDSGGNYSDDSGGNYSGDSGSKSFCGDGICDFNESPNTCPSDCKCTYHFDCESTELCTDSGKCESALNKVYRVTVEYAELVDNQHTQDGDSSYPDPYVQIYFPNINTKIGETSHKNNTLEPVWNESADITVTASGQEIWFCVFDDDSPLSNDDPMYFSQNNSCMGFNNVIDFIKQGDIVFNGSSDITSLSVSIVSK